MADTTPRNSEKPIGDARSSRRIEYIAAAGVALAAFVISPIGIQLATGRANLTFRVNVISLVFVAFLMAIAAAVLARGRLRRVCFHAIAWIFPLVLLAGIEAVALSIRLADIIAPLEDTSSLVRKGAWPGHLYSDNSFYWDPGGFILYRPWQGDGITFNALGLRTAMPTPKKPGEWRIAVTGGSAVWGWRVLDADTIPVQLQDVLRRAGHGNVTVYNFGIGGATLQMELPLLKRFRDIYAIDQVVFYTGGNNAIGSYLGPVRQRSGPWAGDASTFELMKVVARLQAISSDPSPQILHWLDDDIVPAALKGNSMGQIVADADGYCRSVKMRCDFVLQPMLFERKTPSAPEARMVKMFSRIYPRIDILTTGLFGEAMASGPAGRMHDFAHIFDQTSQTFFLDLVHLNEAGNRAAAENLVPIVAPGLP